MKLIARVIAVLILIGGFLVYRLVSPYRGFPGETYVEIPRGTSTSGIADLLANAGVVRARWDFLLARWTDRKAVLQAGEYRFSRANSAIEVYDRIGRGDIFSVDLLVPEGRNVFDIGAEAEKLGLFPASEFVAAAHDTSLIRDLDPAAPTLEGYLFPNRYKLSRHITPAQLCRLMTERFREVWKARGESADVHRTVTLASLVEKESKLAEERARIAGVFENRLRIGMKLDCDPTTIYAALLDDRYGGVIHKSDLASDNLYNTYTHAGLPPGPIANPGRASIEAVLHPAPSDALYFVLKPDGSGAHVFSANIAAHEAAAAKYRRENHK